MKKRIITLSGKMGSGKSELAKLVHKHTFKSPRPYVVKSFGTEIKKICKMMPASKK